MSCRHLLASLLLPALVAASPPQVVVQTPIEPALRRPIRIRTPTHDWQLEIERGVHLTVRDATTGFVLYSIHDRYLAGVSADPDRGVLCAVLVERPPITDFAASSNSELYAIGWDLANARELWRRKLPPGAEKDTLSFHQTLVLGDRCLVIGTDNELALRLTDGTPVPLPPSDGRRSAIWAHGYVDVFPADGLAVLRNADGFSPGGSMIMGIDDARPRRWTPTTCATIVDGRIVADTDRAYRTFDGMPPVVDAAVCTAALPAPIPDHRKPATYAADTHTWTTRGAIWSQNVDGLAVQHLDHFELPKRVAALAPVTTPCRAVSDDRVGCVDKKHATFALLDGTRLVRPTPLPAPCKGRDKDVYDVTLSADGQLAMRCDNRMFVGRVGARLRPLRPLGLGPLAHRLLAWVDVDGAPRLLIADADAGVMLLDADGRERWRRTDRPHQAQLGPRGTVFIGYGETAVLADVATGESRATIAMPGDFLYSAAIVGDELLGPTGGDDRICVSPVGEGWKATLRFGSGGIVALARASAAPGLVVSTGWIHGSTISDTSGHWLATTRNVDGGAYILGGDGTFACRAAGCEALRCTVDGESRPIDDAACAPLRRDTWSLPAH